MYLYMYMSAHIYKWIYSFCLPQLSHGSTCFQVMFPGGRGSFCMLPKQIKKGDNSCWWRCHLFQSCVLKKAKHVFYFGSPKQSGPLSRTSRQSKIGSASRKKNLPNIMSNKFAARSYFTKNSWRNLERLEMWKAKTARANQSPQPRQQGNYSIGVHDFNSAKVTHFGHQPCRPASTLLSIFCSHASSWVNHALVLLIDSGRYCIPLLLKTILVAHPNKMWNPRSTNFFEWLQRGSFYIMAWIPLLKSYLKIKKPPLVGQPLWSNAWNFPSSLLMACMPCRSQLYNLEIPACSLHCWPFIPATTPLPHPALHHCSATHTNPREDHCQWLT